MISRVERILILAKTYPSPSAKHVETSCVAGINELGAMRRLYPLPFRLIEEGQQFKKWQWIEVRLEKASKDHRPESHKVFVDTLVPGIQIGREARHPEWTEDEQEKLLRQQLQGSLFSESDVRQQIATLRKVPYDFHYRYLCQSPDGEAEYRHKIVDWEAGALFWNCRRLHGMQWEDAFRARLGHALVRQDLMFLMGNQHRFPDQWLIISLVYPPRQKQADLGQYSLFAD